MVIFHYKWWFSLPIRSLATTNLVSDFGSRCPHHLDPEDSVLASKFSCLLSRCVAKNTMTQQAPKKHQITYTK